ncbi:universal stress protein [Algoriphagus antarcticus]|uniref:Nucleotide-binding universal stress UspA family protein n=1 Tax=Algoriphagus antarcticus TaxID=238540 RepID=A0A3E0D728_9BACT|nr:universal stress protein [Algoriphagus antarcticus]REG78367.1 nucleotide-binding universal stress UspA family protein [Algoriphagus antarcticus]
MNILVPLDFGKESENAKTFAAAVAKSIGGKVILLHAALQTYNFASLADEEYSSEIKRSKNLMKKYVEEFNNLGITASYRVIEDNLESSIEKILSMDEIDFIILGTKGAKGVKKFLLGSNANEIFKNFDVPILIIPITAFFDKVENIVLTLENPEDGPEYVRKILHLTKNWGLPYEILHFNSGTSDDTDDLAVKHIKLFEKIYPDTSFGLTSVFSTSIQTGLEIYQKEHPEAMLVMLSGHKNFLEKQFNKSETVEMVYHTTLPLLIIKENIT